MNVQITLFFEPYRHIRKNVKLPKIYVSICVYSFLFTGNGIFKTKSFQPVLDVFVFHE